MSRISGAGAGGTSRATTLMPSTTVSPSRSPAAAPRVATARRSFLTSSSSAAWRGGDLRRPLALLLAVGGLDPQGADDGREVVALAADLGQGAGAGQRLDAAHARGDAALGLDEEEADLAGVAHVGAAAELEAEAGHVDHAHALAVLLAEERHRAGGDRLLVAAPADLGRHGAAHPLVDPVLDLALLAREHGAVG